MAKTLLDGVNDILLKQRLIQGIDQDKLTTLVDEPRQIDIDTAVQAINEMIDELYSHAQVSMPTEMAEATFTLGTNDRDYCLAEDLIELKFPIIDETNGRYIKQWEAGYMSLVAAQPTPSTFTGLPYYAAIRPTDGELYLDRIPTASENGLVYKYRYDRELTLTNAADEFPFNNVVYRALIAAANEYHKTINKKERDDAVYNLSMGRAARELRSTEDITNYRPRQTFLNSRHGIAFPFEE